MAKPRPKSRPPVADPGESDGHAAPAPNATELDAQCPRSLWADLLKNNASCNDAINAIAKLYEPVAISVGSAYAGRGPSRDELIDLARQALRSAILTCAPDKRTAFAAYAKICVRHELVDFIREQSYSTRHEFDQNVEYETAKRELGHIVGRSPTPDEIYAHLKWSETKRRNHAHSQARRNISHIDAKPPSADSSIEIIKGPESPDETLEQVDRLNAGLAKLDRQSRRVITERYYGTDRPSQKIVASRLGCTEYRVRELEAAAFQMLRDTVRTADDDSHVPRELPTQRKEPMP